MIRGAIKPLLASIVLASACYFVAMAFVGTDNALEHLLSVPIWGLTFILALSLSNYLIRFARWHWYMNRLGYPLPKAWHLLYYISGLGLTTTPAKAGEAIRSLYLKSHGVPYTHSLGALFSERAVDLFAIVILSAFGLGRFGIHLGWIVIGLVSALVVIVVLRLPQLQSLLKKPKFVFPGLQRCAVWLGEMTAAASGLFSTRLIIVGVLLGVFAWGAEAFGFYLISVYLELDITLVEGISIFAFSILIGALSFVPGGLGTTEVMMGSLLLAAGVDPAMAIATTILSRVTTLWFAVVLGLSAITVLEWSKRGLLFEADAK